MAFNANKDNISKQIEQTADNKKSEIQNKDHSSLPTFKEKKELSKNYTFSLKPSLRKKLDLIAKEQGYQSTSKFLDDWIEQL